jgi:3-oxoacyl-[acyl-carrier-protein] synthase-3
MKRACIASTGSYLPQETLHNEDLDQFSSSARLMISAKTGIFARKKASKDECTSDLAVRAAKNCLEKIGFSPRHLDAIVVSTSSPDRIQPATATRVQDRIGACAAFAFDINSVCSGSVYGLALSDSLIKSGLCRNVLFIAAEMYSRILNPLDFTTSPYFGDGAGAILFRETTCSSGGVLHSCLKTDGSGSEVICVPAGGTMMPYDRMTNPSAAYFKMKGKSVYQFAVHRGTEIIEKVIESANVSKAEISCYICHQANLHILMDIAERLNVPMELFFINLFRYGNLASASVLVALDEAICLGYLSEGDLIVTAAYGGGLSWGANLIEL